METLLGCALTPRSVLRGLAVLILHICLPVYA